MDKITLNDSAWHTKWFRWSNEIWQEFKNGCEEHRFQTNLCYYIRTMVISAPIVILLHLALYGTIISLVTYIPFTYFGGAAYGVLVGTVIGVIALIYGFCYLFEKPPSLEKQEKRRQKEIARRQRRMEKGPGFVSLFWNWIVNQKKKVCPIVEFNRDIENE